MDTPHGSLEQTVEKYSEKVEILKNKVPEKEKNVLKKPTDFLIRPSGWYNMSLNVQAHAVPVSGSDKKVFSRVFPLFHSTLHILNLAGNETHLLQSDL